VWTGAGGEEDKEAQPKQNPKKKNGKKKRQKKKEKDLHERHDETRRSLDVKEGKVDQTSATAHFPPPHLYGSLKIRSMPPKESSGEGALPEHPFPSSPNETRALIQSVEKMVKAGKTTITSDGIIGQKLFNFRDLSGCCPRCSFVVMWIVGLTE